MAQSFLADADNMLVSYASAGKLFGEPPQLRFKPGEGLAGWVYRQGQPLLVNNTAADPRYKLGPTETIIKPRSMILAPLRRGEKIIGVVSADFDRVEAFDENDLRLLNTLALHSGTVLQNIEFFEDFRVLHEAATDLAKHATLEQIYQTAVQFAIQTLHCKHSTIFMLDKKSGQLVAQTRLGLTPQTSADLRRFEPGEGLAGQVIATGQPLLINNAAADARFVEGNVKPLAAPRSIILAPIKVEEEIIGVISADKDEIGGFTEHNLKILETLALDVGIAVENARLYDLINNQLSRRIKELRAVSELQQKISGVNPVEEQLQIIYDATAAAMAELMDTRNMYIALYDEETKTVEFPLAYDKGRRVPDEEKQTEGLPWTARRLDGGKGLTEWMIRHKQPLLVAQDFETWLQTEPEIEILTEGVKCCLGAPLLLGDKVIGVIGLLNSEQEEVYDENQRALLVTLAGQAAIAINNARQYELLDRRVKELDAVRKFQAQISNVGSVKQELQDIYDSAAEAMSELMDTRNMYIALYDEKSTIIEFALMYEVGKPVPRENPVWNSRRFGERQGLTEWVIRHRQPLLIEKNFDTWIETQEDVVAFSMGTKCWLGAPMLLRDKVIGVIGLQNFENEGVFDQHHRDLLMMIASQAAIAIDNAYQYDLINNQLARRIKELEAVSKFQQKISSFSM
ncbi:MAG: GAF domain-containing protein [Anaerolineales bacterium]|nr:GAF domain-containing protein [Anaerolineales bacterium]